jgi:uncharacterized coiled-coil DUF342 family protein
MRKKMSNVPEELIDIKKQIVELKKTFNLHRTKKEEYFENAKIFTPKINEFYDEVKKIEVDNNLKEINEDLDKNKKSFDSIKKEIENEKDEKKVEKLKKDLENFDFKIRRIFKSIRVISKQKKIIYKKIDEVREEKNVEFDKFKEEKKLYLEISKKLKTLFKKENEIMKKHNIKRNKKESTFGMRDIKKKKENLENDFLTKGKTLTAEDLLLFQMK